MAIACHTPIFLNIEPEHVATTSLALLGPAINDQFPATAFGMADSRSNPECIGEGCFDLDVVHGLILEPRNGPKVGEE